MVVWLYVWPVRLRRNANEVYCRGSSTESKEWRGGSGLRLLGPVTQSRGQASGEH